MLKNIVIKDLQVIYTYTSNCTDKFLLNETNIIQTLTLHVTL